MNIKILTFFKLQYYKSVIIMNEAENASGAEIKLHETIVFPKDYASHALILAGSVVSSRVKISRNLKTLPFPCNTSRDDREVAENSLKDSLKELKGSYSNDLNIDELKEKHLFDFNFLESSGDSNDMNTFKQQID